MKKILLLTALTLASNVSAHDYHSDAYYSGNATLTNEMGHTYQVNRGTAIVELHQECRNNELFWVKRYRVSGLLNDRLSEGVTPLHSACAYGSVEVVLWLLSQPEVAVNASTDNGYTALDRVLASITNVQAGRRSLNNDVTKYQAIEAALRANGATSSRLQTTLNQN